MDGALKCKPRNRVTDHHRALIRENWNTIIQGLKLIKEIEAEGVRLGVIHYLRRLSSGYGADPDLNAHRCCIETGYLDARGRLTELGFNFMWDNSHSHRGTIH